MQRIANPRRLIAVQRFESSTHRMYYVYFLKLSNERIYTGITEDLKRRFSEHFMGKIESTKFSQSKILIGYEAYKLKSDALRREKFLKTTEGRRLFRRQYRDILIKGSPSHATGRGVE